MKKNRSLSLILSCVVLIVVLLGCYIPAEFLPPTAPPQQPDVQVAVAQTLTAIALLNPGVTSLPTQPPPTETLPPPPTETPSLTFSPTSTFTVFPTPTLSAVASPLPPLPLTAGPVWVSVSVDTNCRSGPGKIYDYRGALLVGETTEVVGREGKGEYWYVRNPDKAGDFCWVWGKYATLSGSPAALPVLTPPPTPTPAPDFSIVSARVDKCVGWFVSVKVKNAGPFSFESIRVKIYDPAKDKTIGSPYYNGFEEWKGCIGGPTDEVLESGNSGYVQSNDFAYDPKGHNLKITVTMCTENDGGGTCVSRTKTIKP